MKAEDYALENERETSRITGNGKKRCPNLRNIGEIVFYCGSGFPECASVDENGITNKCIERKVEPEHLDMYCMGIYRGCAYFITFEHPIKCRID